MTVYRVVRASDDVIAAPGQTVTYDPVSNTWVPTAPGGGGGAVDSVNGKTGAVVLDAADVGAAPASHDHAASDITSGTLAIGRIPTGTTSSTVALGNHTHTPAAIGAATAAQGALADTAVQPGDDAGTLGSGAATSGQVLTADGSGAASWQEPGGGGGFPIVRTPQIGQWLTSPSFNGVNVSSTGEVRNPGRMPLHIPEQMSIDQVSFSVGTAEDEATWTVSLLDPDLDVVATLGTASLDTTGEKIVTLGTPLALDPGWYFVAGSGHTWNGAKFFTARISGWGATTRGAPYFNAGSGFPPADDAFSASWQMNVPVFWVRRSA